MPVGEHLEFRGIQKRRTEKWLAIPPDSTAAGHSIYFLPVHFLPNGTEMKLCLLLSSLFWRNV